MVLETILAAAGAEAAAEDAAEDNPAADKAAGAGSKVDLNSMDEAANATAGSLEATDKAAEACTAELNDKDGTERAPASKAATAVGESPAAQATAAGKAAVEAAREDGEDVDISAGMANIECDLRKDALKAAASAASTVDTEEDDCLLLVSALREARPTAGARLRWGAACGVLLKPETA